LTRFQSRIAEASSLALNTLHNNWNCSKGCDGSEQACSPISSRRTFHEEFRFDYPPIVDWVGHDWAGQKHGICLQATGGRDLEYTEVEQKPEASHGWIAELGRRFP
jgi:hypothetical protein